MTGVKVLNAVKTGLKMWRKGLFGQRALSDCSMGWTLLFDADNVTFSLLLSWEQCYLRLGAEKSYSLKPLLPSATIANRRQKTFHIHSFKMGHNNAGEESAINKFPLTESTRLDCMGTSVGRRWAPSVVSNCMGKEVFRMCLEAFFPLFLI